MPKSLRHYRRRNNKTQRLRKGNGKMTGGYKVFPDDQTDLHELKELLGQPDRHLFALHSDKDCGYCTQFEPEWKKVLARLTPHPNMTVAKLGQGATDYMNEHHYRRHNHAVNGVPTIIYYIANNKPREYDGERTADKIIDWLSNVMADNNLELTIKPKSQDDEHAAPASVPLSEVPDLESASVPPASVPLPEQAEAQPAFPQAPLPPASTLSNAADTIRTTAANVDDKISQGVSAIKSALTSDLDLGSLFSSSSSSDAAPAVAAPAAPAVAAPAVAAPNADLVPQPVNVPQVPSLVGGRRRTRRNHSPKKSKKSRKAMKSRSKK